MTLGSLLEELYAFLGDDKDAPVEFDRADVVELVNEGCREFRRRAEERWARIDMAVVAGQAIYAQPGASVRLERVAYDDVTMFPDTVRGLQAIDERWQQRTSNELTHWTAEGVAHNQFRVYPEPTASTPDSVTFGADINVPGWSAERGAIRRLAYSLGGQDATQADPNVGGWSAERGLIRMRTNTEMSAERGTVRQQSETGADNITLWYVERPGLVTDDNDEIPIKQCYQRAVMWWALGRIYGQEGDRFEQDLKHYCEAAFSDYVDRCSLLTSKPLAYIVDKIGPTDRLDYPAALSFPNVINDNGTPRSVHWPRHGQWH